MKPKLSACKFNWQTSRTDNENYESKFRDILEPDESKRLCVFNVDGYGYNADFLLHIFLNLIGT